MDDRLIPVARSLLDAARQEESEAMLTTTACARALGVTGAFIRGEIRDGRLVARVFTGARKRAKYRVPQSAFTAYVQRYWPQTA